MDIFDIEDQKENISEEEHDKVYQVISNAKKNGDIDFKYYEITWQFLLYKTIDLGEMVPLQTRLEEKVNSKGYDEIVCHDLSRSNYRLIEDTAASTDTELLNKKSEKQHILKKYGYVMIAMVPFLLDQLLSLIYHRIQNSNPSSDVMFVPDIARPDSMTPVLNYVNNNYEDFIIVLTPMLVSLKLRDNCSEFNKYDTFSINAITSLRSILTQIKSLFIYLPKRLLIYQSLQNDLNRLLIEEYDVSMRNTVQYAVINSINSSTVRSMLLSEVLAHPSQNFDYNKAVIGTDSALGRGMTIGATRNNSVPYMIPHSVAVPICQNPPSDMIHYVSGKCDKNYILNSNKVSEPWKIKPLGRPYFATLLESKSSRYMLDNNILNVLIATQPSTGEFLESALSGISSLSRDADIIIKTHPDENGEDYEELIHNCTNIVVHEDDLHEHLKNCDLVLTRNSNVGVEAMVMGKVCVCIDPQRKSYNRMPYTLDDSVPVLTSETEAQDFFANLSNTRLQELHAQQSQFIEEGFRLDGGSAKRISLDIMDDRIDI
jgi:hypothetical protein